MFWERNICLFVLLFLVHAHTTYCYTRTKIHKLSKNTRKGKWHIIQTLVLLFGFFLSVKHGAVWMYQNSWLSFYSAVFNLAQWFRLLIVPHRNTILSSVTPVTWKEEHRTFHSVQTFQLFKLFKFFKNGFSSLAHHFFLLWLHKQQEEEVGNELFSILLSYYKNKNPISLKLHK